MEQWIELASRLSDFGDKRLNKRFGIILEELSKAPMLSIPASCSGWKETLGTYRFLNNEQVSYSKVLEGHIQCAIERMQMVDIVSVSYTHLTLPTKRIV